MGFCPFRDEKGSKKQNAGSLSFFDAKIFWDLELFTMDCLLFDVFIRSDHFIYGLSAFGFASRVCLSKTHVSVDGLIEFFILPNSAKKRTREKDVVFIAEQECGEGSG